METETKTKPKTRRKAPSKKASTPKKKAAPVQATPVDNTVVEGSGTSDDTLNLLMRVKNKMKITKVTATRCVKTKRGDHFVAFSSEWDSVRDDSEHGVLDEQSASGMDLQESSIALTILQFKCDTAAIEGAFLAGDITEQDRDHEIRQLRGRYGNKLKEMTNGE
jgi:hypothetical protein